MMAYYKLFKTYIELDLEVIKLEFILGLKIKRNDWLLAETCPQIKRNDWLLAETCPQIKRNDWLLAECPQAANHCALF